MHGFVSPIANRRAAGAKLTWCEELLDRKQCRAKLTRDGQLDLQKCDVNSLGMFMCIYIYTHIHTYIHIYICIYVYVYIYTYVL